MQMVGEPRQRAKGRGPGARVSNHSWTARLCSSDYAGLSAVRLANSLAKWAVWLGF